MTKLTFDFSSITPTVDVICLTHEGVNKALLEFSDTELMEQVVGYLQHQAFISFIMPGGKDILALQIKDTFDTLQILERICTTLELHNKTVSRKLRTSGNSDSKIVQSYLLKG